MLTEISPETLQLGAVAIIFIFAIKEFFSWLKNRKGNKNGVDKQILDKITEINENHLNEVCKRITDGNREVTKAITDMHKDLVEILGEIRGRLDR